MKLNVYQGGDGDWYWRIVSRNGRTLADGAEGYTRKASAERAAASFRDGLQGKEVPVVTLDDEDGLTKRRLPPIAKGPRKTATPKAATNGSTNGTAPASAEKITAPKKPAKKKATTKK